VRILIVSSVGGHLTEVMRLSEAWDSHEVALVVNDAVQLPDYPFRSVYRIAHAERDARVMTNFVEAARILEHERPDVILSTGAGPVVPFAILARALRFCRIVFVESAAAVVRPTLTGRIMYQLADAFFYQWPSLEGFYPRGQCVRVVFP